MSTREPPYNRLTHAQAERLAVLAEELGEAVQAIGKVLRHGYEHRNPMIPDAPSNRQALMREIGDVLVAVGLLCDASDLDMEAITQFFDAKRERIGKYLHY